MTPLGVMPIWRFGPQLLAADRTRFRLWAPDIDGDVSLEVEGLAPLPMHIPNADEQSGDEAERAGWRVVDAACGAGARYLFRLPDGSLVPDPASRLQSDDIHDPSVVVDAQRYVWRNTEWLGRPWHETILYELHVGTLGGFRGVVAHLPAIAAQGFTAIELMPVADFPGANNWGYDGVLPYAPDASYGSPDDLRALIDAAHDLGLMVFLDVVYNHFGPDGNYLSRYARRFFRTDMQTPWGSAIDFREAEVRSFFTENALYWLTEFRFDGLRFDAVHAIADPDWLDTTAVILRSWAGPERHIHLVLENEHNGARLLDPLLFDAQWNDDGHNVLHVLLTGEHDGYYADFAEQPAVGLARVLAQGFIYQGQVSEHLSRPERTVQRGESSAHLSPTAFVLFLQNHDQIGNRAFGERLTLLAMHDALCAAIALQLLSPQIPLCFMGEETGSTTPFLYFTQHNAELADAVREGRRREFSHFPAFASAEARAHIPDPNSQSTFLNSVPQAARTDSARWSELYRTLLMLRQRVLFPHLATMTSAGAHAIGSSAVAARWHMNPAAGKQMLALFTNLGANPVTLDASLLPCPGHVLFESTPGAASALGQDTAGILPAYSTVAYLENPPYYAVRTDR